MHHRIASHPQLAVSCRDVHVAGGRNKRLYRATGPNDSSRMLVEAQTLRETSVGRPNKLPDDRMHAQASNAGIRFRPDHGIVLRHTHHNICFAARAAGSRRANRVFRNTSERHRFHRQSDGRGLHASVATDRFVVATNGLLDGIVAPAPRSF